MTSLEPHFTSRAESLLAHLHLAKSYSFVAPYPNYHYFYTNQFDAMETEVRRANLKEV